MILVAVGQQKFQFNRLIHKIDELIENGTIKDKVFIQYGSSDKPKIADGMDFVPKADMQKLIEEADLMIIHSGAGMIVEAAKLGKRVIAVPRMKEFGEHVDNHQFEIAEVFENTGYLTVEHDKTLGDLGDLIQATLKKEVKPQVFDNTKLLNAIRLAIFDSVQPKKLRRGKNIFKKQ